MTTDQEGFPHPKTTTGLTLSAYSVRDWEKMHDTVTDGMHETTLTKHLLRAFTLKMTILKVGCVEQNPCPTTSAKRWSFFFFFKSQIKAMAKREEGLPSILASIAPPAQNSIMI